MPGVEYFRVNNDGPATQRRNSPSARQRQGKDNPREADRAADGGRQTETARSVRPSPPASPRVVGARPQLNGSMKRAASKPFNATSPRKSVFAPNPQTPGPTDYTPEAADALTMPVAHAKSIGLPGKQQCVDMEHLYYDRTLLGPGTYERPEETAQRVPAGSGHTSNFVSGTGRQAIDPAELAVRNGMPFAWQHPDAQPRPGPTGLLPSFPPSLPPSLSPDCLCVSGDCLYLSGSLC